MCQDDIITGEMKEKGTKTLFLFQSGKVWV